MELEIRGPTKEYGNKLAVNNLSIIFKEGVNGLLGANGSGKTTLMRIMCDIVSPTSGKVLLDGTNISSLGERYREILGYLPQEFGYYPNFTAWDMMIYLSSLKELPELIAQERCKELLNMVGLYEVRNQKIKTYSGGMKQRLGISQALINNPKILILDEPTVGLDPKERSRFRNIISELSTGKIIILSTHIVSDIEYIAERIMIMKEGCISQEADASHICDPIEKYVWSLEVRNRDVDYFTSNYLVSNFKNKGEFVELRIVSEDSPSKDAVNIPPTLEDLYLYHFKD